MKLLYGPCAHLDQPHRPVIALLALHATLSWAGSLQPASGPSPEVPTVQSTAQHPLPLLSEVFFDDFAGSALDASRWRPSPGSSGQYSLSNGLLYLGPRAAFDTNGLFSFQGSKVSVAYQASGTETAVLLIESNTASAANLIMVSNTLYRGWGLNIQASGNLRIVEVISGGTLIQAESSYVAVNGVYDSSMKYYRVTLEGDLVTLERGANETTLTERITARIASSSSDRRYYLTIGTGTPPYAPGTFDWVSARVSSQTPFLHFPLQGLSPENAPINSIMDHSVTIGPDGPIFYNFDQSDSNYGVITAYTGEQGVKDCGRTDCAIGESKPRSPSFRARGTKNYSFFINGNYTGAGYPQYLSYTGHSGFDFRATKGTPVYAPADGIAYIPNEDVYISASNPSGAVETFGIMAIDHGNGYASWFAHMGDSQIRGTAGDFRVIQCEGDPPIGLLPGMTVPVRQGCQVGKVGDKGVPGAPHLHFEVRRGVVIDPDNGDRLCKRPTCIPVDPYGWAPRRGAPVRIDPYTIAPNQPRLWIQPQASPAAR